MSPHPALTPELQLLLQQFYYREARLLDNRQYQTWLGLCSPEISYSMPARANPLVDNRQQGHESMISSDRELEGVDSNGCPLRDENFAYLALRVERSFKRNAWAENPPARTRRIIGNVELLDVEGNQYTVCSNFHLHYSRPGARNFLYAGQRRDVLLKQVDGFIIQRREIIMDMADVDFPTLGLFL
jgi:3-phenylpropionate/cinnamic acid dioxygenase small subunit